MLTNRQCVTEINDELKRKAREKEMMESGDANVDQPGYRMSNDIEEGRMSNEDDDVPLLESNGGSGKMKMQQRQGSQQQKAAAATEDESAAVCCY